MQGELSVTSTPGVGSCFQLRLPLRVATMPVIKPAQRSISLQGLRLLLIEDNPLTQHQHRNAHSQWRTGPAAVDCAEER